MEKSLQCLAELLQGEVAGDGNVMISGLAPIETAREGQLTFLSKPKCVSKLAESRASAVLVAPGTNRSGHNAIVVHNPRLSIGDNAMISGQSGVMGNVAPGDILSGTPAISHQIRLRAASVFPRPPEMRKTLNRLGLRMESAETRFEALKEATSSTEALPITTGRKEP